MVVPLPVSGPPFIEGVSPILPPPPPQADSVATNNPTITKGKSFLGTDMWSLLTARRRF